MTIRKQYAYIIAILKYVNKCYHIAKSDCNRYFTKQNKAIMDIVRYLNIVNFELMCYN